jgi:RNA polymerase sigma-70 factor (ECF subfamily)
MWQKFSEFEPGSDFAAWGLRFARNVSLNFNRRKRAAGKFAFSDELLDLVGDEATAVMDIAEARQEALRHCIGKLPTHTRQLIDMRYEPGATVKRVADRLGKPLAAVYKALERAQDTLLRCIERSLAAKGTS